MPPQFMNLNLIAFILGTALFAGMTALQVVGHAVARREAERTPDQVTRGLGAIEGAVFGLLALLMGFTFSSALGRFELRKELIVSESVVIGSTWQWLDVITGPKRDEMRAKFRDYTDTRIQIMRVISSQQDAGRLIQKSKIQQNEIWSLAIAASKEQGGTSATTAMLSSLNEMFDLADKRLALQKWHVPVLIFVLLVVMALCCSFLAGHSLATVRSRHWIAILAFSFLVTLTILVILDLEFPRMGFIRVDDFDAFLEEARAGMD